MMAEMDKNIYRFLFVLLFAVGFLLTFLTPPFQKPDESGHFIRSLSVSDGLFICPKKQGNNILIPRSYRDFLKDPVLKNIPVNKYNKLPTNYFSQQLNTRPDMNRVSFSVDGLCAFPIVSYIPQALALKASIFLSFSPLIAFYLGRFMNFIFLFLLFIYVFWKTPGPFKKIVFFTFALPMNLYQIGSYSFDGLHTLLGLSLFSILMIYMTKKKITLIHLLRLFALLLLFFISRTGGYEVLAFSVFIIPYSKINKNIFGYLCIMVSLLVIIFILYGMTKIGSFESYTRQGLPRGVNVGGQLTFLTQHLPDFILAIPKTFYHYGYFYGKGLIGIFGWLEYGLTLPVYMVYAIGLFMIIYLDSFLSKKPLPVWKLLLTVIILKGTYLTWFVIFYLVWTPVGNHIVDGIQGRYFLVLVPFAGLVLMELRKYLFPKLKKINLPSNKSFSIVLYLIFTSTAFAIVETVIRRYYWSFWATTMKFSSLAIQ